MAGPLHVSANLANDLLFRARVEAAMMTAGLTIAAEAVGGQSSSVYQLRHQLAVAVLNNAGAYLDRFAWAVAVNSTISGEVGAPVSIVSSSNANPVVVTATAHGYSTGDVVEISGHLVNTAADGCWTVTTITGNTFSIPALGNGVGVATGSASKQPPDADIQFAVNTDWSSIAGIGVTT